MVRRAPGSRAGVTAVVPTIPPRARMLRRALESVQNQEIAPEAIAISMDTEHLGAAENRNQALDMVTTPWVAFLDDDDEWLPGHLRELTQLAEVSGADLVYPWFTVPYGFDPLARFEGKAFRGEWLDEQNMIPITVLARTALLRELGGFTPKGPPHNPCEDWGLWLKVRDAGGKIVHLPKRTWLWHWHPGNTSGRADVW